MTAQPRMRRVLGLRDLVVVGAASMGPAFSLATTLAAMIAAAGRWTWLALVIVTVLMVMIAAGYKRLGERMRNAGSSYSWIRAAFGPEAGAYGAWILLVASMFAVLATALPAGTYTLDLLRPELAGNALAVALAACGWIVATALLLWYGLRPTTLLALLLLVAEIVVLGAAATASAGHARAGAVAFSGAPLAWGGMASAIVLGVWLIDGWESCASTAEESQGAASAPGAGALIGLGLTSALLLAAIWAFTRIGSAGGFAAHESDALAYVGELLGGGWTKLLSITVLVSLAASLQTTLVYLSRSVYAMGRDGLLPRALGELDRRAEPAASIALITVLSLAFTLAAGVSPTANVAFQLVLKGTAWFVGVLFVMTAAASVWTFFGEAAARWTGVLLPGTAAAALSAILLLALKADDPWTRGFIAASAIIGLPLALWRGRAVRRAFVPGAEPRTGSRF
ncbi:MAG: APC family permease [Candidatus Eremiobacteraeota bacterium]|nr:APC family permease [Candidatus Eremiobacteraeota bacterium]